MKKNSLPYKSAIAAAVTAASLLFSSGQLATVQAADHRDGPAIDEDPRADILDIYAFTNPNNTNKVVLAMTVNPFEEGGAPGIWFSKDVLYQFKIDNTGDYKEDLVIQATFTEGVVGAGTNGQQVTIIGPAKATSPKTITSSIIKPKKNITDRFTGFANGTVISNSTGTIRAFAGQRDDPFFFDLIVVFRTLGLQAGPVPQRSPIDFFAGFNCSALIVEVDSSALKGPATQGNAINVWATTSRGTTTTRSSNALKEDKSSTRYVQVERMGKPALNTVLIKGHRKDVYNRGMPSTDRANFRAEGLAVLTAVNGDAAYSNTIIDVLLPDVLTLNMGSTDGYLNGRKLSDDVIDITLNVASHGAVTTDGVNGNDKAFLDDFPFLAEPHAATEAVPARN